MKNAANHGNLLQHSVEYLLKLFDHVEGGSCVVNPCKAGRAKLSVPKQTGRLERVPAMEGTKMGRMVIKIIHPLPKRGKAGKLKQCQILNPCHLKPTEVTQAICQISSSLRSKMIAPQVKPIYQMLRFTLTRIR